MDDIDSGRVSKPQPTTTTHHNPPPPQPQHNKNRREEPSPWPQLPRLRPLQYINAQTCHRLIRCSRRLQSKKMAFHSHPLLASGFAGLILHQLLVTAPPATSTAAHIRLSGCGHAPKPSPSIDIDAEGRRGRGEGENQAACLTLFDLL
jgi:hypothetical protein